MHLEPVTDKTLDILLMIRNSCAPFMTGNNRKITIDEQHKWWSTVKDLPDYHVYVLRHEAMKLYYGYGIIRKEQGRWWLTGGLIPSQRGRGVGAKLFSDLMELVEADGSCCWLQVRKDNIRAHKLYRRLGFDYVWDNTPIAVYIDGTQLPETIYTMRTYPTLKTCKTLYDDIISGELSDERPDWLRKLPHACDDDALYYRFFWELSQHCGPLNVLEIGTDKAVASAHFAAAWHPDTHVVTVDHNPDCAAHAENHGLTNLLAVTMDSTLAAQSEPVLSHAPYDVIFIDGNHTYNQAKGEYNLYRPFLREGGLMFFDDIDLRMETLEMQQFWREIEEPKLKLPKLHHTGFGVVQP